MNFFKSGVKSGGLTKSGFKSGFGGGGFINKSLNRSNLSGGLLKNGLVKNALNKNALIKSDKKSDGLIKGALIISIGGFITKILGAFYRVPLTNILGAEGLGLYQAVFPIYCLLLTLSSTGVPSGVSKIIAEGENEFSALKSALAVFLPLGLFGGIIMAAFSSVIANLQGAPESLFAYMAISPSVALVGVISCFRGFFQGKAEMKYTAVSQVSEQAVKLAAGLIITSALKETPALAAAGAALAVTIAEAAAVIYLTVAFKLKTKGLSHVFKAELNVKRVIKTVVPVTLSASAIPIVKTIDSFLILNILGGYLTNATRLYGLYSGATESLIGVPVSLLYGLAATGIPVIAKLKAEKKDTKLKCRKVILYTLFPSVVFAAATFVFAPLAVRILYSALPAAEKATSANMLKLASPAIIFLSLTQTTAAELIALDKIYAPCVSSFSGGAVKLILSFILLKIPYINVYGAIISDTVHYFVACLINLVYIKKANKTKEVLNEQTDDSGLRLKRRGYNRQGIKSD